MVIGHDETSLSSRLCELRKQWVSCLGSTDRFTVDCAGGVVTVVASIGLEWMRVYYYKMTAFDLRDALNPLNSQAKRDIGFQAGMKFEMQPN